MINIRPTTSDDIPLIEAMYRKEIEDHVSRARKFAEDLVQRYKTLLAIQDDTIYGTVTWERRGGLDDGVAEIIGLGVNERFKRQGIATRLVDVMIDDANKFFEGEGYSLRVIVLFMERTNEIARKFYSAIKFKEVGTVPSLYPQDDASIWTRHL
ncbi:MAG: N-acetyltransferase family protein [Candidatus Thorarchaeota archaeon]|jgi:ribosomal protein S18 acetylase RimI-like enzyme